jgi:hypothetical protein
MLRPTGGLPAWGGSAGVTRTPTFEHRRLPVERLLGSRAIRRSGVYNAWT